MAVSAGGVRTVDWAAMASRIAAAAGVLLLLGVLHQIPRVDGARVRPGITVKQVLYNRGTYQKLCGDEVDVQGVVLRRGSGDPPAVTIERRTSSIGHAMRWGERATVSRGGDVREPVEEYLAKSLGDGGVITFTRHVVGSISGKRADVEAVTVAPQKVVRIALTFDDGPYPKQTLEIIKLLKAYHAHATFFVVGECAAVRGSYVKKEVAAGDEVGIHSWSHPPYTTWSSARISADLTRCQALLTKLGVPRVRWVRPPYGATNARVRGVIEAHGYHQALWDVDTNDWRRPPAGTIATRIMRGVRDGHIILMHDGGGNRSHTIAALEMVLPKLRARGVRMLTLSQLKGLVPAPPTGLVVTEATGRTKLDVAKAKTTVDGHLLDPPPFIAKTEGHLLISAGAVLRAAGVQCIWDNKLELLRATTPAGKVILRADSRRFTLDGKDTLATAACVEHKNELLAPIGLLTKLLGASYVREKNGTIAITTAKARPAAEK